MTFLHNHDDGHGNSRRGPGRLAAGLAAAVLGALSFTACDDDDLMGPSDLMGGQWRLESIQVAGSTSVTPPDPSRYTIDFRDDGRIDVRADCNGCSGSYSVDEDSVTITSLACTRVACPPGSVSQDFIDLLEGTASADLDDDDDDDDDRLILRSDEGRLVLER
jgi:heat shock protein HslJ